ncbi:MAG TPA: DUF2254 domain-containing protein [Ktedonobacterales bacterium]|nr:DUF2254 domain-containing protein [Ktedonobacterales bacterium]
MSGRRHSWFLAVAGGDWKRDFWLWATPLVFFVGAILFALVTLRLDQAVASGKLPLPGWAIGGGAGEVQAILSVVAGASISALTLVFSSALVVLTLAAPQFGSFLLHDFIRMRISRLTLSMFVATFVYSLMILSRVGEGSSQQFVPQISAKIAMVLAFLSVALLIAFIYGISISVQAQQVAALVAAGLRRAIDERQRANAAEGGAGAPDEPVPADLVEATRRLAEDAAPVMAAASGYLQALAFQKLVRAAKQAGGVVRLVYRPGQYVLAGSVLAEVWPSQIIGAQLAAEIQKAHVVGSQRTLQQDLEFAIDKLEQIALLALSSAVNNTFNALICIDWLADGLRMLAENPSDWLVYHDERGAVRVITQPLPLTSVIDAAFSKIRYASGGNPTVVNHLLRTIGRLAPFLTTQEQRDALAAQANAAAEAALKALALKVDRAAVLASYTRTCQILGRPACQDRTPAGSEPATSLR